jgi:hypothetical protein
MIRPSGGLRLAYGYDAAGRATIVTQSRTAGSVTATGGTQPAPDATDQASGPSSTTTLAG